MIMEKRKTFVNVVVRKLKEELFPVRGFMLIEDDQKKKIDKIFGEFK